MDDEKLIELVRKFEFLYNLKHPKYMDSSRKDSAWKEIANQLQQSVAACKERWQNLRDAYRRALNKKKQKSGQAAKNTKPWKYENEMAFVVPFFVKRVYKNAVENKSEGEEESDHWLDEQPHPLDEYKSIVPHHIKIESVETKMEDEESDNQSVATAHSSNNNSECSEMEQNKSRAKKRKMIELDKTTSDVMKRLLSFSSKPNHREHNEVDDFFLVISDTVKKFTPYLQAVAKNKIFNLVSEMELQMLKPPTSSASTQ